LHVGEEEDVERVARAIVLLRRSHLQEERPPWGERAFHFAENLDHPTQVVGETVSVRARGVGIFLAEVVGRARNHEAGGLVGDAVEEVEHVRFGRRVEDLSEELDAQALAVRCSLLDARFVLPSALGHGDPVHAAAARAMLQGDARVRHVL
jgi:hypothetical protein